MSDYLEALPLENVKGFLNLSDSDNQLESWLQREIKSQLQTIEQYIRRPVVVQQFRDALDGTGKQSLYPDHTPVQSVINLSIDNDRRFGADTRIQPSEYVVDDDAVEMLYDRFPHGRRNVKVEYIAGYAEIEIPFSRRRFDIRESANGELLTLYLPTGTWRPTELAEALQDALNSVGDFERSVRFDWTHRHLTISQSEGDLHVVTHVTNEFTSTESATLLLGFKTNTSHTDGKIVGAAVDLGIPEAIKGVALELIAMQYAVSSFNGSRYGLRSYRLSDYQVTYETGNESGSEDGAGIPMNLKNRLKPYKKWDLI